MNRIAFVPLYLCLLTTAIVAQPPAQRENPRDRWNKVFTEGAPSLRKQPSALLVGAVANVEPGTALDLGIGEGRNAFYLAGRGWKVTGVDISDVAVDQVKKHSSESKLPVTAVVSDLDAYDFGKSQWDLITSFFMHSWHRSSKTDIAARIYDALKPGGLVVIEAFSDPPHPSGLSLAELGRTFSKLHVIRQEIVEEEPDWGATNAPAPEGKKARLTRFVARKEK
jgi:SAM-dependent methyltransferase